MAKNVSKPSRTTPPVRVSFPQVFVPKAVQAGSDPKYGIVLMFDKKKEDHKKFLKVIHDDAQAVLNEQWPDASKRPRIPMIGATGSPIKDGDITVSKQGIPIKEKNPEYAGHYIIRCSTKSKPKVVDLNLQDVMDPNEIYGGCICKVNINAYGYDMGANQGVTFGLNGVQKWADGDSFGGGRPSIDSMFEAESGQNDAANYASDDPFEGVKELNPETDLAF